jgi:hypothetical protein
MQVAKCFESIAGLCQNIISIIIKIIISSRIRRQQKKTNIKSAIFVIVCFSHRVRMFSCSGHGFKTQEERRCSYRITFQRMPTDPPKKAPKGASLQKANNSRQCNYLHVRQNPQLSPPVTYTGW